MDFNRFRLPGFERPYGRGPRNKGYLVCISRQKKNQSEFAEDEAEIRELSRSANTKILGLTTAVIIKPNPSHFLREGKLHEIWKGMKRTGANVLVVNVDLSPSQAGNIESFLKIPVMDRTGLILEIFGRRAQSREGKLQVEYAQLQYALPRLAGLGTVMSRLGGGIGTRGPGEKEIERDRRKIRKRIDRVRADLKKVGKHRDLIRAGRRRKNFTTVALVGYTNAGKSTLLNALTGAEALVEDKLFATLDPKARVQSWDGQSNFMFIDTVGFLRDLPHSLIESFHGTLEEVVHADLLVHVLDVSHPHAHEMKQSVEIVLKELKASDKPCVLALNKADLLTDRTETEARAHWPEGVFISAQIQSGLEPLLQRIRATVQQFQSHQP